MTSVTPHHRNNQYTITDINIYNKIIEYGIQKLIVYTTDISILSQMIVSIANMIKRYRCLSTITTANTAITAISPTTSITATNTITTTTSSSSGTDTPGASHTALTAATPIITSTSTDVPGIGVDVGSITASIVHICIKALFQSTGVAVTLPLPPYFNTTLIATSADTDSSSSSTALTTTTATAADNSNSNSNNSNTNNNSSSSNNSSSGSKVLLANLLQSQEEYSKGKIHYL